MPNQEVLRLCSAGGLLWCSCLCLLVMQMMERGQPPAWIQEKNLTLKYCGIKPWFREETEQFWEMKHRAGGCTRHDFKAQYECRGAKAVWGWCEDTARPKNLSGEVSSFTLVPRPLEKEDHLLNEWGEKMCIHIQKLEARSLPYIIHKSYKAQNDKNPRKH